MRFCPSFLRTGNGEEPEKLIQEDIKSRERWGKSRDQWESSGFKEKIIESITFYDLLKKHDAPKIIDYVAFDMEGSEYDALKFFPFEEYKIMAFNIEGNTSNELLLSKVINK